MMVEQNKWRATRFGGEARLVDSDDYRQYSVQETVDRLIALLLPQAKNLDCVDELKSAKTLPSSTGARRQLQIYSETNSRREVVRRMLEQNSRQ